MPKIFLTLCLLLSLVLGSFTHIYAVDQSVTVSATVPATVNDFTTSIESASSGAEPYPQDTIITYTINYGSLLSNQSNFTLEAHWNEGTITGGGSAEVVDYVIGSASNAYGGTPPIIDTLAKTISWDIDDFPANTIEETVTFQLKTKASYTGTNIVTFETQSRISGAGVTTEYDTDERTYRYINIITPTVTPTPSPRPEPTTSVSTTSSPTTSPTPTETQKVPPIITHVSLQTIASTYAEALVKTNIPTTLDIYLGTTTSNLKLYTKSLNFEKIHLINFDNLKSTSSYYFRLVAKNSEGQKTTSDIFTFKTASTDQSAVIEEGSLFVNSNKLLLATGKTKNVFFAHGTSVVLHVPITNNAFITSVVAKISNSQVLGIQEDTPLPPENQTRLVPALQGIFSGELYAPRVSGTYTIALHIRESTGALYKYKLPFIFYVGNPITVVSKTSHKPIEGVRVLIKKIMTNTHENISFSESFSTQTYTDNNGQLLMNLPEGSYVLLLTAPGHADETFNFSLDNKHTNYPTIKLTRSGFLSEQIKYFIDSCSDAYHFVKTNFSDLILSPRGQEVAFLSNFLLSLIIGIFVIRMHTTGISEKNQTYMHWLKKHTLTVIIFILPPSSFILTMTILDANGILSSVPLMILMFLNCLIFLLYSHDMWRIEK